MRWSEIIRECGGKTVKGVNTTVDVQPGEIARQAAKFGNKVDANGLPPVWTGLGHKTGAKDTPNKGDPVYGADGTNPKKNRPIVESVSDGERFVAKLQVLYHGTTMDHVPDIKAHGLLPDRSQSSLNAVFLAADTYTAGNYAHNDFGDGAVILAIDMSKLDWDQFGPDNYELPDMLRDIDEDDPCFGLDWSECDWRDSLRICGQVAYHGIIPPAAIVAYSEQ